MSIAPTRFRHGRLYITFRCNARCGYCNVWQDPVFAGHRELTADGLRRCLDEMAELGISDIDITGGEPALHRELLAAVRHGKELGMTVVVTTNAIRFAKDALDVVPLVDTLNISLDTLSAQRYHSIRGTDTLARTISLVDSLREQGASNLKLICVVTEQNIGELDTMLEFAQQRQVSIYLSPMFNYFEGQSPVRLTRHTQRSLNSALNLVSVNGQPNPTGPVVSLPPTNVDLLDRISGLRYEPNTVVSLVFLHRLRTLNPVEQTSCAANSRILTVGPDGQVMLPCYHEWDGSLAWDRPYRELVTDPELIRVRDEEVGVRPGCRRCTVFPYLGLSASYRLTTPFLVQAFSEELLKIKPYAHVGGPLPEAQRAALLARSDAMLDQLEQRSATLRPGQHLDELYHMEMIDQAVHTDLGGQVTLEEVLADHSYNDCWRVQRTPHRLVRLLYNDILTELSALDSSEDVLAEALDVQLACWEVLFSLLPGEPVDNAAAGRELAGWCDRAGRLLAVAGADRACAALAVLAAFSSLPAERIADWGTPRGHAEELLAVKLLRGLAAPARRTELAGLFSAELRPALLGQVSADVRQDRPTISAPSPERARQGVDLDAFLAQLRQADTEQLRSAVRRWKAASDPADAEGIERQLLRQELAVGMS